MHTIVPIIIIFIICVQLYFFIKNYKRMRQFRNIFANTEPLELKRNTESSLVNGVYGKGNEIFTAIIASINKYLGNNTGSVIDFNLLKDAVDRHCDTVENDIATQTPIPLYWGLAGTMAGVIIGLWDLLQSDAIMTLMGSSGDVINSASQSAAYGVNSLLKGVAWAMGASICGIVLTTVNSILFKKCKLEEEEGKNSFLAWMQSVLLPELPSDTSEALNNLVKNLNKFNNIFKQNTSELRITLRKINEAYAIQADIVKDVHDMDFMKMARANVNVLKELQQCTDKLEVFNQYLDDVNGYTEAIHNFESQFNKEANRIHVLEEIRDFFSRHKGEISKTTVDADNALKESLKVIKESTTENVKELNKVFVEQSETFKKILADEKEEYEQFASEIKTQFSAQMTQMPQVSKQLAEISAIPKKLDDLIGKIESSNQRFANDLSQSIKQSLMAANVNRTIGNNSISSASMGNLIPSWMKFSGWAALVIIAISCILNVVFMFFPIHQEQSVNVSELPTEVSESVIDTTMTNKQVVDEVAKDSIDTNARGPVNPIKKRELSNFKKNSEL